MSSAFYQLDPEWRFTYVNSEAERLLGQGRAQPGRRDASGRPSPRPSAARSRRTTARPSRTGRPVSFEAYYPPPLDGWYEVRAWPSPEGLAVYFVDITARREAQDALDRSAHRLALLASVSEGLGEHARPGRGRQPARDPAGPRARRTGAWSTLVEDPHASDWRRGLAGRRLGARRPAMHETLREYASLRLRRDDRRVLPGPRPSAR